MGDSNSGNELKDKTIVCLNCGQPFVFPVGEQIFFKKKNYNDPKRCKPCLEKRREGQGKIAARHGE